MQNTNTLFKEKRYPRSLWRSDRDWLPPYSTGGYPQPILRPTSWYTSLRGTPPINHGFYAAQPLMLRMEGGETSCFYNTIFMKFSPSLPSLCVHLFINIYISLAIYLSFLLKIIFPSPLLCLPSCYSRSNLFPSLSSCLSLSTLLSFFLLGEFSWFFSWKP